MKKSKKFEVDNKKYIFASKFDHFNNLYHIDDDTMKYVNDELLKSINFLNDSFIEFGDNSTLSLFDLSYAANYNPNRYKAELWNRVNTMKKYANDKGFDCPVFITLTPPTIYKPLKQIKLKNSVIKMVDNPNFCGDNDFIKNSRDYISNSWRKFLTNRIFKDIKKEFSYPIMFIRTYEPFIDGSAHCHIVAFIPLKFRDRFVKLVKNYFKSKTDVKYEFNGDIGGVISYILKYIFKTFIHSKNKKLTRIACWYIYYNIRRFSCSRTLVPMYIYRKVLKNEKFRDLKNLTNLYKDGSISLDLIALNDRYLKKNKLLFNDCKIDTIIISILGTDNISINYIAYKKSYNYTLNLSDKKDYSNSKKIDFNSLRKNLELHRKNKTITISKLKDIPLNKRSFKSLNDLDLLDYYLHYNHNSENLHRLALLHNEIFDRKLTSFLEDKKRLKYDDINFLEYYFSNISFRNIPF